jgi:signal transduction histidine kinase
VHSLVERVAGTTGLEIGFTCDLAYEHGRANTRHTPELESSMYRLVQESLTNVVKHAAAAHVTVALTETDATVQMTVTDDGAGFETEAASGGFGLLGMRERIALLNGHPKIDSAPGRGTTVAVRLPVARPPAAAP